MGSSRWNFLFCCFLLSSLQPTRANKPVFQAQLQSAIFLRSRRAASYLLEEIYQGNLERECYEERCSKEEAREYFENDPETEAFWTVYYDGDQCLPNPCQNGGTCVDNIGGYNCSCTELYVGSSCERDISQCPANAPHACEHFCSPTYGAYTCHCAKGYTLHPDGKSCVPHVKHPCGRIPFSTSRHKPVQNHRLSGEEICPQGHCPWQVTLVSRSGEPVCNGVILGPRAVLTTATCMTSKTDITHIHIGNLFPGSKGIRLPLEAVPTTHSRFKLGHQGHDLCFLQLNSSIPLGVSAIPLCLPEKDFTENILMQDDQEGLISPGHVRHSYVSLHDCRRRLNLSFTLSNKMFCMKERSLGTEHKEKGEEYPPKEGQKLHSVQSERSSQITSKNRLRPRTQQAVWVTEDDLIESEDVLLLSEVQKSTAQTETPTEQTSRASPTQKGTLEPTVESVDSTKMEPSLPTVKGRGDCGLLAGTPVASVKGNTAFLTGLMLSHDCSQGLVFTKLSRFLPWLESLLELNTA